MVSISGGPILDEMEHKVNQNSSQHYVSPSQWVIIRPISELVVFWQEAGTDFACQEHSTQAGQSCKFFDQFLTFCGENSDKDSKKPANQSLHWIETLEKPLQTLETIFASRLSN